MAFFLQLFLLVPLGSAAVHRERHLGATLSFEVQSSGAAVPLVRRHQDEDQDSNATEANGTDDLEAEVGMGMGTCFWGLFDDVGDGLGHLFWGEIWADFGKTIAIWMDQTLW